MMSIKSVNFKPSRIDQDRTQGGACVRLTGARVKFALTRRVAELPTNADNGSTAVEGGRGR
jgi:hypothetical protein